MYLSTHYQAVAWTPNDYRYHNSASLDHYCIGRQSDHLASNNTRHGRNLHIVYELNGILWYVQQVETYVQFCINA